KQSRNLTKRNSSKKYLTYPKLVRKRTDQEVLAAAATAVAVITEAVATAAAVITEVATTTEEESGSFIPHMIYRVRLCRTFLFYSTLIAGRCDFQFTIYPYLCTHYF